MIKIGWFPSIHSETLSTMTGGRKVGYTQTTFEADLGTKNIFYIRELKDPKTTIWERARKY